ncbi:MAG TPA: biopolymer transporter ExbD [Candidatus Omnitrophota bacterium]|nr:biopolymer transporter ExbD [Candidatus Omnitrophota bacterium]
MPGVRRRPRNSKLIADINIAPFTDVILVLLIIFMVTTPLIYRSSIKIALPQVSDNPQPLATKDINVMISAGGEVYLENQKYNLKLDRDLLRFKMRGLVKANKNSAIIINGDRNVKYDYVVQVIDAASKAGIKHLVLATEFKR